MHFDSEEWIALYLKHPRTLAFALGALMLAVILAVHRLVGFTSAFLPLYILPIWISTRLGGRRIGIVLVSMTTASNAMADYWTAHQTASPTLWLDSLIRFISFGSLMLLFAYLEESLSHYRTHARQDPLTGLWNRRALGELALPALNRARRREEAFTVAVLDCDNFKALNDTHGHHAGDRALQLLAEVLERTLRSTDLIARTGGDEFVVVLRNSQRSEVEAVFERIDNSFTDAVRKKGWRSSLSMGFATLKPEHQTLDDLIQEADDQMYRHKVLQKQSQLYLS